MKTEKEIKTAIKNLEADYKHVLNGSLATIAINAPRALEQIAAESKLTMLYWVIGKEFESKLVGTDR